MKHISRADELVLLAVWRLQDDAYGVTIRKLINDMTHSDWSVGAIYDSLEKLTRRGLFDSFQGEPSPERGGKKKRFFAVTESGIEELKTIRKIQESMWKNLPNIGFKSDNAAKVRK